jgi:tRNA (Thr-GGU) A37 N-methylase
VKQHVGVDAGTSGQLERRQRLRPNPIGMHRISVAAIEGNRIRVSDLEAVDGTPILDLKPVLSAAVDER